MWSKAELAQMRELLEKCVGDADADIVNALRRNDGKNGSREALLSELDVLEKVRERLNVRFNRIADHH